MALEQPTTVAWMVTHLDSPEALDAWKAHMMHKARIVSRLDALITNLQGRVHSYDCMIERDRAAAKSVTSEYLRGQCAGEVLMTELIKEWSQRDLEELRAIQQDLRTALGC